MRTLKDIKCNQSVSVVKLHGEGAVKRRIMDMGITKGTQVFVRKVAPLGDPVDVYKRQPADCTSRTESQSHIRRTMSMSMRLKTYGQPSGGRTSY